MTSLLIFAVTYLLITVRRLNVIHVDRPTAVLIGAVAMVLFGVLTPSEALAAVDGRTIILLFGVMGLGVILTNDGVFAWAESYIMRHLRTPRALLGSVIWGAGISAAFITNDAAVILFTPVLFRLVRVYRLRPMPFVLALATAVNTGSVATVVGNPQNMLCASFGGLDYRTFLFVLGPVAVMALAVNHLGLVWWFRADLKGELPRVEFENSPASFGAVWAVLAVAVLALLGVDIAFAALGGVALLLLRRPGDGARMFTGLDWSILVFFSGLFVVVAGFIQSGFPALFLERYPLHYFESHGHFGLSAVFLFGSNVFSNVPFILVVRDAVDALADPAKAWLILAMASTFAGNMTLVGSVANIIVAEGAREDGGIGFLEHLKVGFPLAVVTTFLGAAYIAAVV